MSTRAAVMWMTIAVVGCAGGARGSSRSRDLDRIEQSVDAICACPDLACVDRASADWDALPWPRAQGGDRPTFERSTALSDRGNRCQIRYRAKPDLDLFAAWAERMCACADPACAGTVDDEAIAWLQRMQHEPVRARILTVAHDAIVTMDGCHATAVGATPAVEGTLPDELVARIDATATRMCACSTLVCAELFDHELLDWIGSQFHRPGVDPTTGMVLDGPARPANGRYQRCHDEKAAKWPHRSRLLENYGIEP